MALDGDLRHNDFDPLSVDRTIVRRDGTLVAIDATANCAVGSARRLLYETAFLDNRLGLSLQRQSGTRGYSVYYDRIEDAFFRRSADTLSAGVAFPVRSSSMLEVYAGVTDGSVSDSIAFVGLMLLIQR